jgi:hypothetical protein
MKAVQKLGLLNRRSKFMTPNFIASVLEFEHFDRWTRFKIKVFGVKLERLDYAIFRLEADQIFPEFTPRERATWAVHAALMHPGFQ